MGNKEGNSFSKGLGFIAGFAGAILGAGVANEDPELNAFVGFLVGGFIGYIGGWIVGEFLTWTLKVILAIISALIIIFRVYRFLSFLGE
ncbi:hypothetical protein [Seonamhaeicola sp.]|uniref:hypothetical protein n=1 Tax=Seonamhaeicola sp. TaxID=1912245 RepID=UPI0026173E1B|nr:hypothetical protein [Seonamhaeicola sp.]